MSDEVKKSFSFIPHPSVLIPKVRRALRGEVDARTVALETVRRGRATLRQRRERASLERLAHEPARLRPRYARLSASELLEHFRRRDAPRFLPGFQSSARTARLQRELFPDETERLIFGAGRVVDHHRWPLLGYGEKEFGEKIDWLRDPLSGAQWPRVYHADITLARGDGSDVRVLWELNRMGQSVTLGRAYSVTGDERFAEEFFAQCESWAQQNPLGVGPNWACAMEVALRSINLLAAFELFRHSPLLSAGRLSLLLKLFHQHAGHIRRNLEFSYIATSNHYLSDVVGLLWLGIMLPEMEGARAWREFARRELLRELDKQVLEDGADCESSTGYHRFVLELFFYSFILCRSNGVALGAAYEGRLRAMLEYVRAYLRPCGRAPLIGDTDSGLVLPLGEHRADDHAYLLALGAAVFKEPRFKTSRGPMPEEVLWFLGDEGVSDYESLGAEGDDVSSQGFPVAGTFVMREGDLYLLCNASGSGVGGRGSHGHNDALSLEVSACGRSLIIDPGTYVYTADLTERHLFRSTRYHSTVEVEGAEQNTTRASLPFVIGDEARPRVLSWETKPERDSLVAEHYGYTRLGEPVIHRRSVLFEKRERFWKIEDTLEGLGEHLFRFFWHFAGGLELTVGADKVLRACDKMTGARLLLVGPEGFEPPTIEPRYASHDYGEKHETRAACWTLRARAPLAARWFIVPVCPGEDERALLELILVRPVKI